MRNKMILGSLLALGVAGAAMAKDGRPSFAYVEGAYVNTSISDDSDFGADLDGNGYAFKGSLGAENFHVFLNFTNQDFDTNLDLQITEIGMGGNWAIAPRTDAFLRASYVSAQGDRGGVITEIEEDGLAFESGVRGRLTEAFELEGSVRYVSMGSLTDDTSFRAEGRYFFTPNFSLSAGGDISNEAVVYLGGLRFTFAP